MKIIDVNFRLFLLLILFLFSSNSYAMGEKKPCEDMPQVTYQDTLLSNSLRFMEILQGLTTKHTGEISSGLKNELSLLILEIGSMIEQNGCFQKKQIEKANKILILLSVHNDNFHVKEWNENKKIIKIFKDARSRNSSYLEKTRERDWTGLMR